MFKKRKLGKVFLCLMLEAGALCGVPVSPREIENLMQMTGRAAIERVQKNETGDGDQPAAVPGRRG
ncbi:MAG TPA: hypothetical protein VFV54_01300 [Thermoanaerobaculia bacterium]|nr:hypothetical protein [Thermoanaerobaculia bacterium]